MRDNTTETETHAIPTWECQCVWVECLGNAERMRFRIETLERREGANAQTGPGVHISHGFAQDIERTLRRAAELIAALRPELTAGQAPEARTEQAEEAAGD